MKKVLITLTIILLSQIACQPKASSTANIQHLSSDDFEIKMQKLQNEIVLDIRSLDEIKASGAIANAENINFYDDNFLSKIDKLDKNRPVMVYCAGGVRSKKAASKLSKVGFTEIYNLKDGFKDWQAKEKIVK